LRGRRLRMPIGHYFRFNTPRGIHTFFVLFMSRW
jgi:hypothetical protein